MLVPEYQQIPRKQPPRGTLVRSEIDSWSDVYALPYVHWRPSTVLGPSNYDILRATTYSSYCTARFPVNQIASFWMETSALPEHITASAYWLHSVNG
jgi:hypothetical protein